MNGNEHLSVKLLELLRRTASSAFVSCSIYASASGFFGAVTAVTAVRGTPHASAFAPFPLTFPSCIDVLTRQHMQGALHEHMGHMRYIWLKEFGRLRRPALEGARTRHQRPCRCPLRPERAALASWAMPAHTSLMASSTTDVRHCAVLLLLFVSLRT